MKLSFFNFLTYALRQRNMKNKMYPKKQNEKIHHVAPQELHENYFEAEKPDSHEQSQ